MAASVVSALAAGAGLGLVQNHRQQDSLPAPPPKEVLVESGPVTQPALVSEKEKSLLALVEEYASPEDDKHLRYGVGACLQLGEFYLEQRELDKAEQFFRRLMKQSDVRPYQAVGRLGEAVVLAFRGEADESNRLFLEARKSLQGHRAHDLLVRFQSPLHPYIVQALTLNAARGSVPDELKPFLKAPEQVRPRPRAFGGQRAPAGKSG
jgi:hypothetical protein